MFTLFFLFYLQVDTPIVILSRWFFYHDIQMQTLRFALRFVWVSAFDDGDGSADEFIAGDRFMFH